MKPEGDLDPIQHCTGNLSGSLTTGLGPVFTIVTFSREGTTRRRGPVCTETSVSLLTAGTS